MPQSGAGTVFTFWQRKAHGLPPAEHYVDRLAVRVPVIVIGHSGRR
jgi:hypothetical protein